MKSKKNLSSYKDNYSQKIDFYKTNTLKKLAFIVRNKKITTNK